MRILIIGGISQSLLNFRGPLIQAMLDEGHEVIACAGEPLPDVATTLTEWGVRFIPVPLARAGMNPLGNLRTFRALRQIMRDERPEAVLAYTIKPVIWGGLVAHSVGIRNVYSLITGLGYAFVGGTSLKQRLANWVAKRLYKASLKHSCKVFFQNPDDCDMFVDLGLVRGEQTVVVSGSGVDVDHFKQTTDPPSPCGTSAGAKAPAEVTAWYADDVLEDEELITKNKEQRTSFLLIARLLRDKGICEYAEAAAAIQREYPTAEFHLVGDYDPNPSGLKPAEVEVWTKAGTIIYHGRQSDVRPFLRDCDVYVLPSFYREGTPRTVLEAMATGRAIITTDAPGCRETVRRDGGAQTTDYRLKTADFLGNEELGTKNHEHINSTPNAQQGLKDLPQPSTFNLKPETPLRFGVNGVLIPPRDAGALAEAMRFFIEHPEQIAGMGRKSRLYAEERYDVRKVNAVMLREMRMLGGGRLQTKDCFCCGICAR